MRKFLEAVTANEDLDPKKLWNVMLDDFGKYKTLNTQTKSFVTHSYSTVTRMIKVLTTLGVAEIWDE